MNFYKRIMGSTKETLSEEQIKKDFYINAHHYIFTYLWGKIVFPKTKDYVISITILSVAFILCLISIIIKELQLFAFIFSTIVFFIFVLLFTICRLVRSKMMRILKETGNTDSGYQYLVNLKEKTQRMFSFRLGVISIFKWIYLRFKYKNIYKSAQSNESNNQCYSMTYLFANIFQDSKIKILWLLITDTENYENKYGHAVLLRKNWIYDMNERRTYNKDKYLNSYQAKVYKAFTIEEYKEENFNIESYNLQYNFNNPTIQKNRTIFCKWCFANEGKAFVL